MKKCLLVILSLILMMMAYPVLSENTGIPDKIFDEPKQEYTVTEKEGLVIPIDLKGMPLKNIEHKAKDDKSFYYYLDSSGIHIFPIQKGKSTITLTNKLNKKDKTVLTIVIDESAVYGKGEESPLRVYVVAEESEYTTDTFTVKYIILGGNGVYVSKKYLYDHMLEGTVTRDQGLSAYGLKVKEKKNTGKLEYKYTMGNNEEFYRFTVEVYDSSGNHAKGLSQVFHYTDDSDFDAIGDTVYLSVPAESTLNFKYYVKGGKPPYTCTFYENIYYDIKSEGYQKPIKDIGEENEFTYTIATRYPPVNISSLTLAISDKTKTNHFVRYFLSHDNANQLQYLVCDKPFARVGDKIHVSAAGKGVKMDFKFYYAEYDIGYERGKQKMKVVLIPAKTEQTDDGYTITCDRTGDIYAFRGSGTETSYRIAAVDE